MIDTEEMQDSCLQIMNVDRSRSKGVFVRIDGITIGISNVVSVIICAAIGHTMFDTAAVKPDVKTARMMISSVIVLGEFAVRITCPAELTAPNNESIVKHATFFEVLNQGGARLIGFAGLVTNSCRKVAMLIPA